MNCRCVQKRKFKATTDSKHDLPVVCNLLKQQFNITTPGEVWGTDITYIPTDEGWLYLAGVKDFGSREIVGYNMDNRMTKELVRRALAMALKTRPPLPDCIHHSDRGSQYYSYEYRSDVEKAGLRASMSGKGNCYDNAPTESFWGCLKQELIYHRRFATRAEAKAAAPGIYSRFLQQNASSFCHRVHGAVCVRRNILSEKEVRLKISCPRLTVQVRQRKNQNQEKAKGNAVSLINSAIYLLDGILQNLFDYLALEKN